MWTGKGKKKQPYTGRFLDLRTLAFALTGTKFTLAGAAKAFGVTAAKGEADFAGPVTPKFIDYLRQDLSVTKQLLEALRTEADRHPIGVDPWDLLSPASLAKGYERVMAWTPFFLRGGLARMNWGAWRSHGRISRWAHRMWDYTPDCAGRGHGLHRDVSHHGHAGRARRMAHSEVRSPEGMDSRGATRPQRSDCGTLSHAGRVGGAAIYCLGRTGRRHPPVACAVRP